MLKAVPRQTIEKAIEVFGTEEQFDMLVEELGELIVALNHYRRGRISLNKVLEEVIDVDIMLQQIEYMMHQGKMVYSDESISQLEIESMTDAKLEKMRKQLYPQYEKKEDELY